MVKIVTMRPPAFDSTGRQGRREPFMRNCNAKGVYARQSFAMYIMSSQMGPGNRFTQAYLSLKREGVTFRGTSSRALAGFTPTGHARPVAFGSTMGGHVLAGGGGLAGGARVVYDEEAELAAAIADSLGANNDGRPGPDSGAGGGVGGAASSMGLTGTAGELSPCFLLFFASRVPFFPS